MKKSLITLTITCLAICYGFSSQIDTSTFISVGGIQQYITVKGDDIEKPILFYLHGGPGAAVSAHSEHVSQELERHFVVVHWDQRGGGKTNEVNKLDLPIDIEVMKSDAEEVMLYLLKTFRREGLYILGNSWGNVLGFHLVKKYPNNVNATIAISPIVNLRKSQELTYKTLKNHFKKEGDAKAIAQLNKIKIPFENAEQMLILHRWETIYNGAEFSDEQFQEYLNYFEHWSSQWMPLYQQLYELDLETQISEIQSPIYVLIGDRDLTTHYEVTKAYFDALIAPSKALIWLKDTGHNIPGIAASKMQEIIIDAVVQSSMQAN